MSPDPPSCGPVPRNGSAVETSNTSHRRDPSVQECLCLLESMAVELFARLVSVAKGRNRD
jgi:hypothetical protein